MPHPVPTRILILRIGAMGDILHALPAVTALRAALPSAHIGWAVEPHWAPLLPAPLVNHIHPVATRAWKKRPFSLATARDILTLRRDLRARHYHLAVDLQGSIRSALIGRLAGTARFIGPAHPRESQARLLYQQRVPLAQASVIQQAFELLQSATHLSIVPVPTHLPEDPEAEAWCDRQPLDPGFILLHPAAGWGAKQWPIASYRALIRPLRAAGLRVLINASGLDRSLLLPLEAGGAQPIHSTVAQLIALTRRARLVIGGDTGPVHLAALLRRPTIALFGPTDPARNAPLFSPDMPLTVLRHPASTTTYKRTSATDPGLAQITVQQVLTAAAPWLGSHEEPQ